MSSGAERIENHSSGESFEGVAMMQLVAVAAARAEGFSLDEILNVEGLKAETYRAADISYKQGLVDPERRERLAQNYQTELARAEDRLSRKISPIDEDVEAWVRFLGTYGGQSAPADWLATLGLTLPDLSRLSRNWKKRLDSDDNLRKRAEKSAKEKKPYDVSSLRVSPAKLIPSPLAKPTDSPAAPIQSPNPVKRWIPRADPVPETPVADSPPLNMGVAYVFPVQPAPASLASTTPAFSIPKQDILPFIHAVDIPDEPPTPEEQAAALAPPREALSGTSLSLDIPRAPATPFAAGKAKEAVPDKPKPAELPKVQPAPAALGGTSLAVDIPRGPVVPFVKSDKPTEPVPAESKLPRVNPAPAALSGTSLAVDIPRGPVTPFATAKNQPAIEQKPSIPEKPVVKPAPAELSGTSFSLNIPRGPVTPFVAAKNAPEPAANPLPPAPPEPPPAKPLLTLQQHAALSVEIATYPSYALAILKRYGLTPPQKVDLDKHYQRIVSTDPAQQAAWHAAYNAHYATLVRMPR